jgi:hypothetical protein
MTMWSLQVRHVVLGSLVRRRLNDALAVYFGGADHAPLVEIQDEAALLASELPRDVREALHRFRLHQDSHAVCVELEDWDEKAVPPTPAVHASEGQNEYVSRLDALDLVIASLLGEPFGWQTIQSGLTFNDIIPVREHRDLAASSGFASNFGLHTEDAFHRRAGDYLGLMCLRNPNGTATTLSGFSRDQLSSKTTRILFESRFIVGANVAQNVAPIKELSPILFGNPQFPYFRINLNGTIAASADSDAQGALDEFRKLLLMNVTSVVFRPGELWYFDNLRVAHGRDAYLPRFDGTDRWLRRLYISSAFRYTTSLRASPSERLLNPELPLYSL